MATKIYGASDDLIEFEGDVRGEIGCYADEPEKAVLIACSDGTMLTAWYGDGNEGIWKIRLVNKGTLFDRIDQCSDENEDPHSDVAYFNDGLTKCWTGKEARKVD